MIVVCSPLYCNPVLSSVMSHKIRLLICVIMHAFKRRLKRIIWGEGLEKNMKEKKEIKCVKSVDFEEEKETDRTSQDR